MARSDVPTPSDDFCAELPPSAWYCLSLADIARLRPVAREGGRRAMPADWDDVVLKYVKETNPRVRVSLKNQRRKTKFHKGAKGCARSQKVQRILLQLI